MEENRKETHNPAPRSWYEVDLRSRKTGDTVKTIFSGDSHDKAWEVRDNWYKENLPEWDDENDVNDLIDGSDGVFAYVYSLDKGEPMLGAEN